MTVAEIKPPPHQSRPSALALALLIAAAFVSGIYFARQSGSDPETYSNDFNVYYFAAREVAAGRDPYQRSLGQWTPYLYPPLLAELTIPLTLLPLPLAAYLWFLISAAATAAAAWMSASLAGRVNLKDQKKIPDSVSRHSFNGMLAGRALIAAASVIIVGRFVLDNFNLGQVNLITVALTVAHVYWFAKNRKVASGFALALAISIKLTPAILLVYHLARLRLKFTLSCVAMLAAITALSLVPFGADAPAALSRFVERTVKNEQGYDLAYSGNQSLRGAVERLSADSGDQTEQRADNSARSPVNLVTLVISLAVVAFSIFAVFIARSEMAATAPFFCAMVMLSPLSWKAHFVMLILPVAYLVCAATSKQKPLASIIAIVLTVTFALFNLTSPKIIGLAAAEWADAHSLILAGAALIYSAVIYTLKRRGLASA